MSKKDITSTSSGYSGKGIGVLFDTDSGNVIIKLVNQKKYASFVLDKSYPLCTLQRYDKKWYVNFRRQKMILQ
jgi:superoxide dismutase